MKKDGMRYYLNHHFVYPEKWRPKGWSKKHDDVTIYDKKHDEHPMFKK